MARFPSPDAFEIREHRPGRYALKVDHTVTKKCRKIGDVVWLDERKQPTISSTKTIQENDAIRKFIGLYYSTTDDSARNGYVKNAKGIKGDGIFGKLSNSGITSPFFLNMKALLRFVLLHCDYATVYRTFDNHDKDGGVKPLVRALKEIARRTSTPKEGDASNMANSDEAADASGGESDLFVTNDDEASVKRKGNKRKEIMVPALDEGAAAKKIRATYSLRLKSNNALVKSKDQTREKATNTGLDDGSDK